MKNLMLFILVFSAGSLFSQMTWEIIYDNHLNQDFFDIHYVDAENVWAVGSRNHILHSSNGGHDWNIQFEDTTGWFYGCYFINNQTGWVVGWNNVLKTSDGGMSWESQTIPNPLQLGANEVFFINPDTGWIVGDYQTIYGTVDGGSNWVVQYPYVLPLHRTFTDVYFRDNHTGLAVGGAFMTALPIVMKTDNGGLTWNEITIPADDDLVSVVYTNDGNWWIAGKNSKIYKSGDDGVTWETTIIGGSGSIKKLYFFDNNKAVLLFFSSKFMITEDAWNTWVEVTYNYSLSINTFDFLDYQNGIGIGFKGQTIVTENGGHNWFKTSDDFARIAFFDQFNGFMINGFPNKYLLKTIDGGYSWSFINTPNTGEFFTMHFPTSATGYVGCRPDELMKTADAGESWSILPVADSILGQIHFVNQNTGFMCSSNGYFSKSLNGGQTWNSKKLTDDSFLRALFFLDEYTGWVVGNNGYLAKTNDGGQNWTNTNLGALSLTSVYLLNEQKGFITTYQGKLLKTADGGLSWDEVPLDGNLRKVVFTDELNGWVINSADKIYHTTDGGKTWEVQFTTEIQGNNDIFFLENGIGWVCNSKGLIAKYSNPVGIKQETVKPELFLYPNPATDIVNLSASTGISKPAVVQIYSMDGKPMMVRVLRHETEAVSFSIAQLPQGVYILRLSTPDMEMQTKLIKQ